MIHPARWTGQVKAGQSMVSELRYYRGGCIQYLHTILGGWQRGEHQQGRQEPGYRRAGKRLHGRKVKGKVCLKDRSCSIRRWGRRLEVGGWRSQFKKTASNNTPVVHCTSGQPHKTMQSHRWQTRPLEYARRCIQPLAMWADLLESGPSIFFCIKKSCAKSFFYCFLFHYFVYPLALLSHMLFNLALWLGVAAEPGQGQGFRHCSCVGARIASYLW